MLVIFFFVDPAVLARRHMEPDAIRPMDHDPVRADVYPSFLRISADHQIIRTDVTTAVQFVPARHREIEQVDVAAFSNIFEE